MQSIEPCPVCNSTSAPREFLTSGDLVCTACGAVLNESTLEDRLPIGESTRLDRSATVYATQLRKRPKIIGITNQRVSGGLSRSMQHWRKQMQQLSASIHLGANEERAWHIFTRCLDNKIHILPRILMCAVCALYALRESGQSMSLVDLATMINSSVTSVRRAYTQVERFIKEADQAHLQQQQQQQPASTSTSATMSLVSSADPTLFLSSKITRLKTVAEQYHLPIPDIALMQKARIFLMFMARAGLITGRRPDRMAVIAILFALEAQLGCHLDNDMPNRVEGLANAMGVTGSTLERARHEQQCALLKYLALLPDFSSINELSNRRQKSIFYASLNTFIVRWKELVALVDKKQLDIQSNTTHNDPNDNTATLIPHSSPSSSATTPSAGILAHLAVLPSYSNDNDSNNVHLSSSCILPDHDPPSLGQLHMKDYAAPSFKPNLDVTSTTCSNIATEYTKQSQLDPSLMSAELTEHDLSQQEEEAYIRTPFEVQAFNASHHYDEHNKS